MDFDKKEFYGIVAKAKKQMQITIDQDCNVADTKPDVEKMIQTRGIVKIQETEMMVDRVRIKGEFVFQGLYGTNDTSAYLESLEYSLPFEEYVHIEGVLPSDYVKVKYTIDDINTILINSRKISIRVLLTFSFQITEEMKEKGIIEIHEENVSVLKKDVQITDLIVNKKDIARLKEELVLPANKANIYQILWTQVDMENLQAKIGEHMIEIQGAMHIFVLYLGEDAQMPVQYARWEIPVDTQLECYECMPGMIGRIGMTLGGQQLEIRPDEDGEERIISLDVTIDCDIKIYEDHKISYIDDGYSMEETLIPEYHMFDFETLVGKNQAVMKADKRFRLEQESGKLLQVLSVKGRDFLKGKERYYNCVVNFSVINLIFILLATKFWIYARFNMYFSVYMIILITWCVKYMFDEKNMKIIYLCCLGLYFVYYWYEIVISLNQAYVGLYF